MPPRHGKSELSSHYDSVYYLGAHPEHRIMLASYEHEFAAEWGGKARDTMQRLGPELFGLDVDRSRSASHRWTLAGHKGGMNTAGVGGPFSGRGANYLKIDDPIKNDEEAQSETIRNKHWNWYTTTALPRVEPNGIVLIIHTRWNDDDLIGRILAAQGDSLLGESHPLYDPHAPKYLRIRLPALAEEPDEEFPLPDLLGREPGEALWPERWPKSELMRHTVNQRVWTALYQQRPTPAEGALFNREWFEVVPHPGKVRWKRIIRRWDTAATDEKEAVDPDFTVGLLLGEHPDGDYYVLDLVRFRESPGKFEARMGQVARGDGYNVRQRMEREPGSQGKLYARMLARTIMRGRNFRAIPSTGNKMLRADTVASAAERREIKVVRGPWNKEFFYEVTRFPFASHDDIVDALSGAYQDMTARGRAIKSF